MATRQELLDLCRDVIAPFIWADKGIMYVVFADDDILTLHLGGTCSGCPGVGETIRTVIEPAVSRLSASTRLRVTSGARVPAGATPIVPLGTR